ncbi:glycoside hydrolase/phage tail family protein [Methylopila sp. 73B]|uniref:baseplate multidomain protein megatron n=1 Tax=Methylopila sp. 73B TaxID=1120792 RepID=UPI00036FB027|nr:glycoside hydrolase/phage tail family protein [Methylopila sp. 73B]
MAVLALTAIGAAIGGSLLPTGITLLGATLSGAAIGSAIGGLAGSALDQALFGTTQRSKGPRLDDLRVTASTEGAAVTRLYGRMRLGGQIIWAARFREDANTESSGGKGGGPKAEVTTYAYYASFALGLCEGPIDGIGRIWADGREIAKDDVEIRLYRGTEDQEPDPKIVAVEGADFAPAYRGLAYLVFEELPLEDFGNRVPQITVEVLRRPPSGEPALEDLVTGVTLIPGAAEFAYATEPVERRVAFGAWASENVHTGAEKADLLVALDDLETAAPGASCVSLIVAWHGADLRVGHCEICPKVETGTKPTRPWSWRVSGRTRDEVEVVSQFDGAPALGGAPADRAIRQAIREMNDRGLKVMLTPFVLMDVPAGNGLPDPYGAGEQPAYPWRGRVTCHPAPGRPGSPDGTAAVAADVAAFFGAAEAGDFHWDDDDRTVDYDGPDEWSYRRFVLHMARIAKAAGGVDAFLIGSEMVGLTTLRDGPSSYPAVAALRALAAEVRTLLPDARIGYGADWTEYSNHRPDDGSGDVHFHLDPLWADPNIDFVGVDNYVPLADWREGAGHLDAIGGAKSPYDLAYLDGNVEGGEGYDWFYASSADCAAQVRTPIVDTAHGEHWVFRVKDFRNWWENPHHDRPGGVRQATPTAWVPQSKPIVFCEIGCAGVDKGANQPNVFVDGKSSESATPWFSNGRRDDLAQRAYLTAQLTHWGRWSGNNPLSEVTGERMIDPVRLFVWTWDARPFPAFPVRSDVWADADNWRRGHWLSGRLGQIPLRDVVADLGRPVEAPLALDSLDGLVRGYALDQVMSARDAIEPLLEAYGARARARGAAIEIANRADAPLAALTPDDLVDPGDQKAAFRLTRAQASEVPAVLKLRYVEPALDYRSSAVEARRLGGEGRAVAERSLPIAFSPVEAQAIADGMLIEASVQRERAEWTLPPGRLALEPGDLVTFTAHGRTTLMRLDEVGDEYVRPAKATRADPDARNVEPVAGETRPPPSGALPVAPVFEALDLPLIAGDEAPHAPRLAAYARPWTPVAVYRSRDGAGFALDQVLRIPSTIGRLDEPLGFHASGRFDRTNALVVELGPDRALESVTEAALFAGANVAAVKGPSGAWEVLQFRAAELAGPNLWRLTELLRGQCGTEDAIGAPTPENAAFVLVTAATPVSNLPEGDRGLDVTWRVGPSTKPRDDATYATYVVGAGARGLTPLAPVGLAARRSTGGDVALRWIRRTRIGGDDFDAREVRLAEETEAYEVAILDGPGAVLRTLAATTPSATYAASDQIADFGALPAAFDFEVRQLSAVVGLGLPATGRFEA